MKSGWCQMCFFFSFPYGGYCTSIMSGLGRYKRGVTTQVPPSRLREPAPLKTRPVQTENPPVMRRITSSPGILFFLNLPPRCYSMWFDVRLLLAFYYSWIGNGIQGRFRGSWFSVGWYFLINGELKTEGVGQKWKVEKKMFIKQIWLEHGREKTSGKSCCSVFNAWSYVTFNCRLLTANPLLLNNGKVSNRVRITRFNRIHLWFYSIRGYSIRFPE